MAEQRAQHYETLVDDSERQRRQQQIVQVDEESVQLVVFRVLERLFAIFGRHVRELIPVGEIVYVPGTSELFLGVIPVRGEIASVLDLARLLGLASTSSVLPTWERSRRILMVVKEEMSTGILVDQVEDVISVPKSAIEPHLDTLDPQLARLTAGYCLFASQPTPILNVEVLFQQLQEQCS